MKPPPLPPPPPPPPPPRTQNRRRRTNAQTTPHIRVRSDERKLHSLNIFHAKFRIKTLVPTTTLPHSTTTQSSTSLLPPPTTFHATRPAVSPTPRESKRQNPRVRQFTEEQLELLDRQVNRIVQKQSKDIYQTLIARYFPHKKEDRVMTHDAAAHRVHAAFRYAVKELIDVHAIREKVLLQLEGMINQGNDDHTGFGFLMNRGKKKQKVAATASTAAGTDVKTGTEHKEKKTLSLKEKVRAKRSQIHEQRLKSQGMANLQKIRGLEFWRSVVRKKHWKALMPKVVRIKSWEQIKYVNFPTRPIDIRLWKQNRSEQRHRWEDSRVEWMHAQFDALRSEEEEERVDVDGLLEAIEEEYGGGGGGGGGTIVVPPVPALSPETVAFSEMLREHTARERSLVSVAQQPAVHRLETWEEIVGLLQQQGVLGLNFHRLWDNDRPRRSLVHHLVRPASPLVASRTTTAVAVKGGEEKELPLAMSTKEWPNRLGRYLLPNFNLVHPSSQGTLEDYFASLSKNAPEKALVGVEAEKQDKVEIILPPWFRVLASVSSAVDERSPLRTNWLRCELSAVASRPSSQIPRLGGKICIWGGSFVYSHVVLILMV